MKVLFVVPYPEASAPSQRLKFEQYFPYFREQGVACVVRPFMSETLYKIIYQKGCYGKKTIETLLGLLRRIGTLHEARHVDLIYLHLEAIPFGPPLLEYLYQHWLKKPILLDMDDFINLPHSSAANPIVKFLRYPKKIEQVIRLSNHVIVVTPFLADYVRPFNPHVSVIPPTINTDLYQSKWSRANGTQPVCIGWSGSYTTAPYLKLLHHVLLTLQKKYVLRIKVVGAPPHFSLPGVNLELIPWRRESEVFHLQEMDIGLYPLPNDPWIRGKGGLKALQYMGVGVPPVCSSVGVNPQIIQDGENGFLARDDEEWVGKISRLIEDEGLRRQMGERAREDVERLYSVRHFAPEYLRILKSVCSIK